MLNKLPRAFCLIDFAIREKKEIRHTDTMFSIGSITKIAKKFCAQIVAEIFYKTVIYVIDNIASTLRVLLFIGFILVILLSHTQYGNTSNPLYFRPKKAIMKRKLLKTTRT